MQVPDIVQQLVFLGATVLLGVPHGAADLLVARNTALAQHRTFSLLFFFAEYLGLIAAFALVFYFFPLLGNLIFILIAAYHFGESDLHKYKVKGYAGVVLQSMYGLFIISVILLPHWEQALSLISVTAHGERQQIVLSAIQKYRFILLAAVGCGMLACAVFYLSRAGLTLRDKIEFLVSTAGIVLIVSQLPMLLAFTAYFVFWHSLRSMHQIVTYLGRGRSVPLPRIVSQMAFYSFMAMLGVGLLGILSYGYADVHSLQLYIFLGLAVLTAPHMRIMHQLQIAAD
jgi:Brp/Blh family beta-carotene 15,15'-monooxygenase